MKSTAQHTELPFDQFSRQAITQDLVNTYIRPIVGQIKKDKKLKIIDLGGHKGHTKDFFPDDDVYILDVFDEKYAGYIKGDATDSKCKTDEFDIAVSFDTLEHILPEKREAFLSEAARISKYAFIVAAPFDDASHAVAIAEHEANELYRRVKGADHPWLKEHIEYSLPKRQETEAWLGKLNIGFRRIPTNNLNLWVLTQGLMFNAAIMPSDTKEVVDVSRIYNQNLSKLESLQGETYRQIYVGSTNKKILKAISELEGNNERQIVESHAELMYLASINSAYTAIIKRLYDDREYLIKREAHLQEEYDRVEKERTVLAGENHELRNKIQVRLERVVQRVKHPTHHKSSKN